MILLGLVLLTLCPIPQINAACVMYGQSHQVGPHWKNLAYTGEALPLNYPEAEEIFKRRCPTLYKEYREESGDGKF